MWQFLHYDEAQDVTYCHVCIKAFVLGIIKSNHNASPAFVSTLLLVDLGVGEKIFE